MPFLGKTAAVIAGNGCHHQMFRLRIAQKLSVTNQIPGVLVICAEIDVLSAGVKHCCGPEQLPPLAIVVVHQTLCGVVQAQGMGRHPFSAPLIHRKALHLMDDSALTNAALKAETVLEQSMAEHPIHDQSLAQGPFAENELVNAQHLHRGLQDQGPRHDDLGPAVVDG